MLERTGAITDEVLEPVAFVLAYPTLPSGTVERTLYSVIHLAHCSGFVGDHDRLQLVWMADGD
jgi:hypothetical protein